MYPTCVSSKLCEFFHYEIEQSQCFQVISGSFDFFNVAAVHSLFDNLIVEAFKCGLQ